MITKNPTLTDDQVQALDDAKVDLYVFESNASGLLAPKQLEKLAKARKVIEDVLKPVYEADAAELDEMYKNATAVEHDDSPAIWSCNHKPGALIPEVPADKPVRFVSMNSWVQDGKMEFKSKQYYSPTYADAFEAFQEAIGMTGDTQHIFFEGAVIHGTNGDGDMIIDIIACS